MISYAITDPVTLDFNTLKDDMAHFAAKADMIVYRDKANLSYETQAKQFLKAAIGFKRVLLHSDYELAAKLNAGGIHLKSTQFDVIDKAKQLGLFVIISTHSLEDAKRAQALGADMITLSPIFDTPNKGKAIGIDALKDVIYAVNIPVLALGGIRKQKHIDACHDAGAVGFAAIGYFKRARMHSK